MKWIIYIARVILTWGFFLLIIIGFNWDVPSFVSGIVSLLACAANFNVVLDG